MMKNAMGGALLVAEVLATAAVTAGVNTVKANTVRGTYAVAAKADGTGGVDVDLLAGSALLLLGVAVGGKLAPHAVALGAGALATFAAREGAQAGAKHLESLNSQPASTVAGSLNQYTPNQVRGLPAYDVPLGQVDVFASQFARG